jgi:hypothetical protein
MTQDGCNLEFDKWGGVSGSVTGNSVSGIGPGDGSGTLGGNEIKWAGAAGDGRCAEGARGTLQEKQCSDRTRPYCNENSGWCDASDVYRDAQDSDEYDFVESSWVRQPGSNNQGGKNGYTCSDGARGHCANDEFCYAKEGFVKGQWSDGCVKM